MQKQNLKPQTPNNSLNKGDLNIIMKTDPLKKNIKICTLLSTFVHQKSSKCTCAKPDSDSEFFGKKHKNSSNLSHFVNQNGLKPNIHKHLQLFQWTPTAVKPCTHALTATRKEHFLSINETTLKNCLIKPERTGSYKQLRGCKFVQYKKDGGLSPPF